MATVIAKIGAEDYKTTLSTATHTIIGDEPVESGGKDLGMSPMDLLASALASCTAITLKMYSQRKSYKVESIEVIVDFNRDTEANFSTVKRDIKLTGDISDEIKQRLLTIANRCPIHQTITHGISINTQMT